MSDFKKLNKLVEKFKSELQAYEKQNDCFVEVWKTDISNKDGSIKIEVKKRFEGVTKDYETHNDNNDIVQGGTSLQGYCDEDTTYQELVEAFGEPEESDGYKVDANWRIKFNDGTVATIYNYKTGKNYNEDGEGLDVEDMIGQHWHIGGNSIEAEQKVRETLFLFRN